MARASVATQFTAEQHPQLMNCPHVEFQIPSFFKSLPTIVAFPKALLQASKMQVGFIKITEKLTYRHTTNARAVLTQIYTYIYYKCDIGQQHQ